MERIKIPGHRQYEIDRDGNVFRVIGSKFPEKPLCRSFHKVRGKEHPNGYYYVTLLTQDFEVKGEIFDVPHSTPKPIHRLLALTFIPNDDPAKVWVNHKDGNKINNTLDNLEWCTISANIQHAFDTGLRNTPAGADHWRFGQKASIETRKKMSDQKKGPKHPRFKGYYIANFKRFDTTEEASKILGIPAKTIWRWCKDPRKTKEGYYFIPVSGGNPI